MSCGLPNPLAPLNPGQTFADVLGYDFDPRGNLPDGYNVSKKLTVAKQTAQIICTGPNESKVTLRKGKSDGDISGDYTNYPDTKQMQPNGIDVLLKGKNDGWHCATWNRGEFAYSVTSNKGIPEADMVALITYAQSQS